MIAAIRDKLRREAVFLVSLALAAGTSLIARPEFGDIDWHVVGSLFNLMAAVLGLERVRLLDTIAVRLVRHFTSERAVTLVMVMLTGIFSMMVTNDVALISLVPLMLLIARKSGFNPMWAVILQTLSANIGSTLTPMGNPQNLFLFSHYGLKPLELFLAAAPFVFAGMAALAVLSLLIIPSGTIAFHIGMTREADKGRTFLYLLLFTAGVAGVFRLFPVWMAALAALAMLFFLDRPLLGKIDFFLLSTFICFFIAIGNLTRIPEITAFAGSLLTTAPNTFLAGLVLSQGISNVPAALMLAPFSPHWRAVFLGVNIGGMGTLIASMASLISYRLYVRHHHGTHYLRWFHILNFLLLMVFGVIFLLTFAD
jgi:Na+/H+ antiporter NhaD/arsenite permease-like protein